MVTTPRREHALVWPDGRIEQIADSSGAGRLRELPDLVRYALALPASTLEHVAFTWLRAPGPWVLVALTCVEWRGDDVVAVRGDFDVWDQAPFSLTPRELDILTLICGGLTNREIAARMSSSRRTIATHVEHILAKMRQQTRVGAAALASERGLLRLPLPGGVAGLEHLSVGRLQATVLGQANPASSSDVPSPRRHGARPILIGLAVPDAGGIGSDRDEYVNGAGLAIAEINERGGVTGRSIESATVEVASDDSVSVEQGFRALAANEVDVIMINYASMEDPSIFSPVIDYGCPALTSMESERQGLWVSRNPDTLGRVFQVGSVWSHYGSLFFRSLSELEHAGLWRPANRRVFVIETRVNGGKVFDARSAQAATQLGWDVQHVLEVSAADAEWGEAVETLRRCQPAAVLVTHFVPRELARFQRSFVEEPCPTLVHCIYAPSLPEYHTTAGAAAEGVVWSTVNGTYSDIFGKAFLRNYEQRFSRPPGRSVSGTAYDQVQLIVNAWARAGNPRAFDVVADELRRTVIRGVSGSYCLGNPRQTGLCFPEDTSDPSLGLAALVFQVQDGENRIISPTPYAEASFRVPPWSREPVAVGPG